MGGWLCDLWSDCPTLGLWILNLNMVSSLVIPKGFCYMPLLGKPLLVVENIVVISPHDLYAPNLEGCEGPFATRRPNVRLRVRKYDKNRHF